MNLETLAHNTVNNYNVTLIVRYQVATLFVSVSVNGPDMIIEHSVEQRTRTVKTVPGM